MKFSIHSDLLQLNKGVKSTQNSPKTPQKPSEISTLEELYRLIMPFILDTTFPLYPMTMNLRARLNSNNIICLSIILPKLLCKMFQKSGVTTAGKLLDGSFFSKVTRKSSQLIILTTTPASRD